MIRLSRFLRFIVRGSGFLRLPDLRFRNDDGFLPGEGVFFQPVFVVVHELSDLIERLSLHQHIHFVAVNGLAFHEEARHVLHDIAVGGEQFARLFQALLDDPLHFWSMTAAMCSLYETCV